MSPNQPDKRLISHKRVDNNQVYVVLNETLQFIKKSKKPRT